MAARLTLELMDWETVLSCLKCGTVLCTHTHLLAGPQTMFSSG